MDSEESTSQRNLITITAVCKKVGCQLWTKRV